jgi:hypothetical protein
VAEDDKFGNAISERAGDTFSEKKAVEKHFNTQDDMNQEERSLCVTARSKVPINRGEAMKMFSLEWLDNLSIPSKPPNWKDSRSVADMNELGDIARVVVVKSLR